MEARLRGTPLGKAMCAGRNARGAALWRIAVDGVALPGLWIVIDRVFRPTLQGAAN
jgi:hypothetical protein